MNSQTDSFLLNNIYYKIKWFRYSLGDCYIELCHITQVKKLLMSDMEEIILCLNKNVILQKKKLFKNDATKMFICILHH